MPLEFLVWNSPPLDFSRITVTVMLFRIAIIIIIIIAILNNITVTVILEKSSGGEFQTRNSSGMFYPYSSH